MIYLLLFLQKFCLALLIHILLIINPFLSDYKIKQFHSPKIKNTERNEGEIKIVHICDTQLLTVNVFLHRFQVKFQNRYV